MAAVTEDYCDELDKIVGRMSFELDTTSKRMSNSGLVALTPEELAKFEQLPKSVKPAKPAALSANGPRPPPTTSQLPVPTFRPVHGELGRGASSAGDPTRAHSPLPAALRAQRAPSPLLSPVLRNSPPPSAAPLPICVSCRKRVEGDVLILGSDHYHTSCLVCWQCKCELGSKEFAVTDAGRVCLDCRAKTAPKCPACQQPVVGEAFSALDSFWHPEHFSCMACLKRLEEGVFYTFQGLPYCEIHHAEKSGNLCAGCKSPIRGELLRAEGKAWHPEHFVCAVCNCELSSYCMIDGKPYCAEHQAEKLGLRCRRCNGLALEQTITALNHTWHKSCFLCNECGVSLPMNFYVRSGAADPVCERCVNTPQARK